MSQTQTADELMFADAPIAKLPPLYCLGTLDTLGELVETDSGKYLKLPFQIAPLFTGTRGRSQLLFLPAWLSQTFVPSEQFDLEEAEGRSANFVYQNNIKQEKAAKGAKSEKISILAGLAGSPERFRALAGQLLSLSATIEPTAAGYPDKVEKIIKDFIFPNGASATDDGSPIVLGYKLKQNTEKADDGGKATLRSGYGFDSFWYATDEEVERLRTVAAEGKIKVGF